MNAPARFNGCVMRAVFVVGTGLVAASAPAHDGVSHAAPTAVVAGNGYVRSVRSYSIPDVPMVDTEARTVHLRQLLDTRDPVMMNFVFTTCGTICPVTTKVLSDIPAKLGVEGRRLRMVSISIDPENDTPLQLKAYARSFQASERWKFLTGRTEDVKDVLLALDSYRGDKMNHEPVTLMRQAGGTSWVRIDGFATPDELIREYRKAIPQ